MEPADAIFARHGTDKGFEHHYGPVYDRLFPDRAAVRAVLEIGIAGGNSLRAWREMFPNATVVGLDVCPAMDRPLPDRVEVHKGDMGDRRALLNAAKGRQFDLIVDDASHRLDHQLTALFHLWPYLAECGHYVIEEFDFLSPDRGGCAGDFWANIGLFGIAELAIGATANSQLLIVSKPGEWRWNRRA